MRPSPDHEQEVRAIEALILEKFRTEPFHNLHLKYGFPRTTPAHGGTCSDKTLSFHSALIQRGVAARLHSAFINGAEIHRLVKLTIGDEAYFADVGNGWPTIRVFPLERDVAYSCFGMRFHSVVGAREMSIYNTRNGTERRQMVIPFDSKSEPEILADIEARFDRGIEYPFSDGLRFSQVVGDRFLFLRDDRLEIYSPTEPFREITGLDPSRIKEILEDHFGFDLGVLEQGGQSPLGEDHDHGGSRR